MNKLIKNLGTITLLIFLRASFALAADQVFFYYTDPAGTPLAMSDSTGAVVWRADYMPFGEESIDLSTVQNNKMFVGKEKDSETGLYYFGARYMDAMAGRFIAIDPEGPIDVRTGKVNEKYLLSPQMLNRYTYSLNNPYKYLDPDGKEVILTSHYVFYPYRHSALLLIPDDQSRNWGALGFVKDNKSGRWCATLSAGPDDTKLVSELNRESDKPSKNRIDATIENPYGKTVSADTQFIMSLIDKFNNYSDSLPYGLEPAEGLAIYNSNSFAAGLLNASGGKVPKLKGTYPGIDKPVPKENFE